MLKPKSIVLSLVSFALAASTVFAQGGKDAYPFLRIDRNPVTAATGFAGSASAEGIAYSALNNSAVIPFFKGNLDAGASIQFWAPDGAKSTIVNAGVSYKVSEDFGFSLAFANQSWESYDVIDNFGIEQGTFTPKAIVIAGGMGLLFSDYLSAGLNLRYVRQKIADGEAYSGFGGDFLLYYRPVNGLSLTGGVVSLFNAVEDENGDTYRAPTSIRLGGDYLYEFTDGTLRADVDLDYYFRGKFCAAAGLEYGFKNLFFLRGGYHYGEDSAVLPSFATVGAGFNIAGVKLDVAYLTANKVIGNTITIGLGYTF